MINIYEIKEFPVIVLVDDRRSFLGFAIKNHSKGNYNHIMILFMPDMLASQDMSGYRIVNISKYLKRKYMLKFWAYTGNKRDELIDSIKKDLKASKVSKSYDFLGIIGQLLHWKWINNPRTYFCSERVSKHLRKIGMKLPKRPSPSELNQLFKKKKNMKLLGHWFED